MKYFTILHNDGAPIRVHVHHIYSYFANDSGGSTVSMRWDEWTDTDDVAMVGVGAGFTWSSHLLSFGHA